MLQRQHNDVLHAKADTDVLIVETAIACSNTKDTVLVGDDTDLLVLLCSRAGPTSHNLSFRPEPKLMPRRPARCWNIEQVQKTVGRHVCDKLLEFWSHMDSMLNIELVRLRFTGRCHLRVIYRPITQDHCCQSCSQCCRVTSRCILLRCECLAQTHSSETNSFCVCSEIDCFFLALERSKYHGVLQG